MYLLDTNVISSAVNTSSSKHQAALIFFAQNTDKEKYLCAVTISEMMFGVNVLPLRQTPPAAQRIAEVNLRITKMSKMGDDILPIDHHVAREHARLRALYANLRIPKQVASGKFKSKHVELWHESVPASNLHISENDLWIAATALNYDLILVTADDDHKQLNMAVPALKLQVI